MKTFVLDLRRMVHEWYCGTKACTMGQFAEQECQLPNDFYKLSNDQKAITAERACEAVLGEEDTQKIIKINDRKGKWDRKIKQIRTILNPKGYRVVVIRGGK